jgi:peroxiredoxin Q/BCP
MPEHTLAAGELAPDFALLSDGGATVRLSDFRGKKVILYFYPKDDTTGCTTQACGFRDRYPAIEDRNAVVLGVSPDGQASHQTFKTKYTLPFLLLVDDQHTVAEAYGVWTQKEAEGRTYWSIDRSHFVVDEQGRIVEAAVKVRPEESVQRAVAALG